MAPQGEQREEACQKVCELSAGGRGAATQLSPRLNLRHGTTRGLPQVMPIEHRLNCCRGCSNAHQHCVTVIADVTASLGADVWAAGACRCNKHVERAEACTHKPEGITSRTNLPPTATQNRSRSTQSSAAM